MIRIQDYKPLFPFLFVCDCWNKMYKLLGGLRSYLKWQDIQTDSVLFRLHNTFTTALLMGCSLIITATQYVGNPIQCIVSGLPTHVINTYCWISSTFTMPDAFRRQVNIVSYKHCNNVVATTRTTTMAAFDPWMCARISCVIWSVVGCKTLGGSSRVATVTVSFVGVLRRAGLTFIFLPGDVTIASCISQYRHFSTVMLSHVIIHVVCGYIVDYYRKLKVIFV